MKRDIDLQALNDLRTGNLKALMTIIEEGTK
jgi:hypothetical protein